MRGVNNTLKPVKNILVIGNGFDLEHGLPMRYEDFLSEVGECLSHSWCREKYRRMFGLGQYMGDRLCVDHATLKGNKWIKRFLNCSPDSDRWCDFEKMMRSSTRALFKLSRPEEGKKEIDVDYALEKIVEEKKFLSATNKVLHDYAMALERDLKVLEYVFANYALYVENEHHDLKERKWIKRLPVDKLLSFNYTDIYRRVYKQDLTEDDCCFVHGRAKDKNIIIGYKRKNELEGQRGEEDGLFTKLQRRAVKRTDNKYASWLKQGNPLNVTFIGCSLTKMDREVLKNLATSEELHKMTVFCYEGSEEHVNNMTDICGEKKFQKLLETGVLEFVIQPDER